MRQLGKIVLATVVAMAAGALAQGQENHGAQAVRQADVRYKTDILVVVAHPDDEGGVTPYLARAIYEEHKKVSVVYTTRGGSGGNDAYREHGPALADVREIEARKACAALGITDVWFLDGKDTASQNVLNSLANWGHGANLEALVRIVRLTRPEVVITWLPGIFIGENHGDHQAAGVLATEAFDLAAEPTAFPAQVAGASKRLELYLENLTPWQPKKLYFFSDAHDQKQFDGTGPAYSIKEISPSQKKPYWRIAMDAAKPHYTQFPGEIDALSKMSDAQVEKLMDDPHSAWWSEPMTLILGKATENIDRSDPIFPEIESSPKTQVVHMDGHYPIQKEGQTSLSLGGPWGYYTAFWRAHRLQNPPMPEESEIGIKAGTQLCVPILVSHADRLKPMDVNVVVEVPAGWKVTDGQGKMTLPAQSLTQLRVDIDTPVLSANEWKSATAQYVTVKVEKDGKSIGEVNLRVLLQASALPQ